MPGWQTHRPPSGRVQGSRGGGGIGYGAIVSYYFPESRTRDLQQATDELIQHLHAANPSLREVTRNRRRVSVEGSPGLVSTLASNSPYQGQNETDVLLSVDRPQGLFYMIFVAPESDFRNLQSTFDEMVRSIRFSN